MTFSEEDNVYNFFNHDDGLLGEESQESEKKQFLVDFDDSRSEKRSEDIVALLPNDPFEMDNMGISKDTVHMDSNRSLPRDPFGMELDIEATVVAISGLMEDLGWRKACECETSEPNEKNSCYAGNPKAVEDNGKDDSKYFAELNFVWTSTMEYKEEESGENEVVNADSMMYMEEGHHDDRTMLCGDMDDLMCFGCEKYGMEHVKDDNDSDTAVDIICFVLKYLNLGVKDLLSIERVCRSLRDAVQNDPYLWTSINIDYPLCQNITNEDLLLLTDRARGKLRSLSLVKCLKISNDGLRQVLTRNLELTKLSVAGSIKLRSDGILHNLKLFNSVALPGIRHLRLGDPIGLTDEQLNEYKLVLGAADEDATTPSNYKPRYFRAGEIYLPLDDERRIDIEICPRCQKVGQVYDCPNANCKVKMHSTKTCRACIFCIARCIGCGCCLDDKAYEETFSFDFLCFECLGEIIFQDEVTTTTTTLLPAGQAYFHQMGSCHVYLCS